MNARKVGGSAGNRGKGRKPGVPNKATANAREAIGRFVDANAHRVQGWLDEIAKEEGARAAYQCYCEFLEYHIPKLARTELTGPKGEPFSIAVEFVNGRHPDPVS